MWQSIPDIPELASTAVVSAVYRELGASPGLSSADERVLVDGTIARLRRGLQGELIHACPWLVAREVLEAWMTQELSPPVSLPQRRAEALAA